ncbi:uncharacterized protein LOC141852551 [Brevipalpus obovatus]|uniref:uncharacterized protein LOC141852551 n=1 Tax=Brevipalpus obovatus TaxID=246614 RepID=UPI003D9E65CE
MNKWYWRKLAPKPFSSLRWWCSARINDLSSSPNNWPGRSGRYSGGQNLVDSDTSVKENSIDGEIVWSEGDLLSDGEANDNQPDWLDVSIASVGDQIDDLSGCVIQSIPVPSELNGTGDQTVSSNSISSSSGEESRSEEDSEEEYLYENSSYARKNTNKRSNSKKNKSAKKKKISDEKDSQEAENSKNQMKILQLSDSKSVIVARASPTGYFSFYDGDLKVTSILGSIRLDGYKLKKDQSVNISTGFGSYQILVQLEEFIKVPSKNNLMKILAENDIPYHLQTETLNYITDRDGRFYDVIIFKLERWRWPQLAALKLIMKPERVSDYWFRFTFSDIRSPVVQWSDVINNLVKDITAQTKRLKSPSKSNSPKKGLILPKLLVCGGQNSGKSSMFRHLTNRLLSEGCEKVYILDLDPGQVEFTPPGIISLVEIKDPLLSPPFVNCLRSHSSVVMSCSVGGISMENNPDLYLANFIHMWRHFQEKCDSSSPIIINTMGWTQGIGVLLLIDIIRTVQPSYLIEIKRPPFDGRVNFPFNCDSTSINSARSWSLDAHGGALNQYLRLSRQVEPICQDVNFNYINLITNYTPSTRRVPNRINRVNNQLAYLCLCQEVVFKSPMSVTPIELNLNDLYFHIENEFPVDKHLICEIIRKSWVHLCFVESPSEIGIPQESVGMSSQGLSGISSETGQKIVPSSKPQQQENSHQSDIPSQNSPEEGELKKVESSTSPAVKMLPFLGKNTCLGSAIVLDVNFSRQVISLITPESKTKLKNVNCIVRPQDVTAPEQILWNS